MVRAAVRISASSSSWTRRLRPRARAPTRRRRSSSGSSSCARRWRMTRSLPRHLADLASGTTFERGSEVPPASAAHAQKIRDPDTAKTPPRAVVFIIRPPSRRLSRNRDHSGGTLHKLARLTPPRASSSTPTRRLPSSHTNPCGAAIGANIAEVRARARRRSGVGTGIIGLNRAIDLACAEATLHAPDAVIAPAVDEAPGRCSRRRLTCAWLSPISPASRKD